MHRPHPEFQRQTLDFKTLDRLHALRDWLAHPQFVQMIDGGDRQLNGLERLERLRTAFHEAAHLVACVACPRSSVHHVLIRHIPKCPRRVSRRRSAAGGFAGCELYQDEEYFVTLAGYAAEEWMNNQRQLCRDGINRKGGSADYESGFRHGYEWVLAEAHAFVETHSDLILRVGGGLMLMADRNGLVQGKKLDTLVDWIKGQATRFSSRDAKTAKAFGTCGA